MCSNHRVACSCGRNQANVMFKNHILPPVVVSNLYCPECSPGVVFDTDRMLADNDWILEFDIQLARAWLSRALIHFSQPTPEFLFDEGYATWNGLAPNELDQRLAERREITPLAKQDMRQYLAEIKRWGCERSQRLREAGWRKAQTC